MSVDLAVRSFVDLRTFAVAAPTGALCDAGRILPASAGPVTISAIDLVGEGHVEALAADLFVFVLAGALHVAGQGIGANRSAVLPRGSAFDWRAEDGTVVIRIACADAGASAGGVAAPVLIDESAPLLPSGAPLAELLVGPTPSCRNHTDFLSPSGEFICGTWDSTPYHRLPMRYRHYELMYLIDGSVTFEDETGRTAAYTAGDVFLVEQGAQCSWRSTAHVKKVYAIYRPTA